MKVEVYDLILDGSVVVQVKIERKKMKTFRLKVYPDGAVKMSVPRRASSEWIHNFLESKSRWISEKLQEFDDRKERIVKTEIRNGASVRFLGEYLILFISGGSKQSALKDGYALYITTPDVNNQEVILKQFEKWWKKESLKYLNAQIDRFYPIIEQHKVPRPEISVRKMKTLWGSCSVSKGKITFNQELIKARPELIDYIVLHELVHFIHPNHSRHYYDFLSTCMPDWKERKKALNKDIALR